MRTTTLRLLSACVMACALAAACSSPSPDPAVTAATASTSLPLAKVAASKATQERFAIREWVLLPAEAEHLHARALGADGQQRDDVVVAAERQVDGSALLRLTVTGGHALDVTARAQVDGTLAQSPDLAALDPEARAFAVGFLTDVASSVEVGSGQLRTSSLRLQGGSLIRPEGETYDTACMASESGANICSGMTGNFALNCGGLILSILSAGRIGRADLAGEAGKVGAAGVAITVPGCLSAAQLSDSCIMYECKCQGPAPLIRSTQQDIAKCTLGKRITPNR